MTTTEKLSWPCEEDEEWAAAVEVRLALDEHVPDGLAHQVLAEALDAVTETGRTARDLFGEPSAYARTAARERVGEEHRARIDVRGLTPGERFTAALGTLGFIGLLVPFLEWIREGLWAQASWSSIATFTCIALMSVLVCAIISAWAAGRVAIAWMLGAGAVVLLGLGAGAAGVLPDEPLFEFPVLLIAVLGGALIVAAGMLPSAAVDRWFTPRLRGDDERWLSYVEGLLRGRHAMPAAEARAHVQEARQHLASSGDSAESAFGPAEVYALRLAEGPRREQRRNRRKMHSVTVGALLISLSFADRLKDPDLTSPWFWFTTVLFAYWVLYAAGMWLRTLSAGRK